MLEVAYIREHPQVVKERLSIRQFSDLSLVDTILEIDESRRGLQYELDSLKAEMNNSSKEIGKLMREGQNAEADQKRQQIALLKEEVKAMEEKLTTLEHNQHDALVKLPNLPHSSVPKGASAEDNEEIKSNGVIPALAPTAKPHWELATDYNLIDWELGVKITGSGFPVYLGKGAKLQRALIRFFLDEAEKAGYREILPPLLVNADSAYGTGQLPDKEGQMYHAREDDFYLVPTAEVPVTNIYRNEIIQADQLPVKLTAYTPCFRREAGSYGKEVRGLNRVHQFDKVEIVQITHPEVSYSTLDNMVGYVESLLNKLELPYRILRLCGGDMGFTSALTYDFEVYAAAQKRWLEVSSVSNFETFQSNRMKIRYRDSDKKPQLAHTLNGSALALPRIVAAILENNQDASGIKMPEALQPYLGMTVIN